MYLNTQFYADFFANIRSTNMVTFTASATCILMLVLIKEGINNNTNCKPHLLMPVPIELCVVRSLDLNLLIKGLRLKLYDRILVVDRLATQKPCSLDVSLVTSIYLESLTKRYYFSTLKLNDFRP